MRKWNSINEYKESSVFGVCMGSVVDATVQGKTYKVWSDFSRRSTLAEAEDGVVCEISAGGYIHKDLTVRKAIAAAWGLGSFRK